MCVNDDDDGWVTKKSRFKKRNCNNNNRIKNQDRQKFQNNHAKVKRRREILFYSISHFLGGCMKLRRFFFQGASVEKWNRVKKKS